MREKKSFIERTKVKSNDQVNIKYFLVFEGAKTEQIYFDAINTHKSELGINPIIDLVPLVRDYGEVGWSNPQKILDRIVENVAESESGMMTYEILLNRFMDYMMSAKLINGQPQCRTYWTLLKWLCEGKLSKDLHDKVDDVNEASNTIMQLLLENSTINGLAENIAEIINTLSFTYDSEIDHICLIVDRDKESFTTTQYQYVVSTCKRNKFDLFITNPCFEFWLLLHFNDYITLDKAQLLINPNITSMKKYTEYELSKRMKYKKNKYNADSLVKDLQNAVTNEKNFCEELDSLENTVGSNLGKLFESIVV